MSRLDELIAELCPDGVEFKTLGEVATLVRGNGLPKSDFAESGIGCIHYGQIYTYYGASTNITKSFVSSETASKLKKVSKNDIIITNTSENLEDVCKAVAWFGDDEIVTGGHATIIKHNQNAKYLTYYTQTSMFFEQKRKYANGIKVIDVSATNLSKITIPIPSLPIQKEIVRILDNFTELTAEITVKLTAELTARKQQYEYYENKLLFNAKFTRVLMKDICIVNQGLQIPISQRKKENGDNRYFYITVQFLKGNEERYYIENPTENVICNIDDILVTRTGSTGKVITGVEGCFHNNFFKINCFESVNKRYVYYVLKSKKMYNRILRAASGGTVPDLPHTAFYKLEIHLPPLAEQERIVAILERLDTLVNDITTGLPAEIEARKQQYEYYRDKLLTFPVCQQMKKECVL